MWLELRSMFTTIIINDQAFEAECCRGMALGEAWGCHKTYDAFLIELRRAAEHAGFRFEIDPCRSVPAMRPDQPKQQRGINWWPSAFDVIRTRDIKARGRPDHRP